MKKMVILTLLIIALTLKVNAQDEQSVPVDNTPNDFSPGVEEVFDENQESSFEQDIQNADQELYGSDTDIDDSVSQQPQDSSQENDTSFANINEDLTQADSTDETAEINELVEADEIAEDEKELRVSDIVIEKTIGNSQDDISLEVNFRPSANQTIAMDFLKGRYFISDRMSARLGLLFHIDVEKDESSVSGNQIETKDRVFEFGLYPGIEWHFPLEITPRVSPYIGAQLGYTTVSTKFKRYRNGVVTQEIKNEEGSRIISLDGFAGVDLHIFTGIYLGAEIGYRISRQSYKDSELTEEDVTRSIHDNEVSYNLGDFQITAIRLGWILPF